MGGAARMSSRTAPGMWMAWTTTWKPSRLGATPHFQETTVPSCGSRHFRASLQWKSLSLQASGTSHKIRLTSNNGEKMRTSLAGLQVPREVAALAHQALRPAWGPSVPGTTSGTQIPQVLITVVRISKLFKQFIKLGFLSCKTLFNSSFNCC